MKEKKDTSSCDNLQYLKKNKEISQKYYILLNILYVLKTLLLGYLTILVVWSKEAKLLKKDVTTTFEKSWDGQSRPYPTFKKSQDGLRDLSHP